MARRTRIHESLGFISGYISWSNRRKKISFPSSFDTIYLLDLDKYSHVKYDINAREKK